MAKKAKMTLKEFKQALESTDSTAYLSPSDGNWRSLLVFISNNIHREAERSEENGYTVTAEMTRRDWAKLHDIIAQYKSPIDEEEDN